jgi:hypothetical protein
MDGTQKKEEDVYGLLQSTFLVGMVCCMTSTNKLHQKMQKKEDDKNTIEEAVTIIE